MPVLVGEGRPGRQDRQLSVEAVGRSAAARRDRAGVGMQPKIMLFDEATSALDPELVGEVLSVIRQLADEGMTMVIVSHEMLFAREVADRIVFMDEGLIVEEGSPQAIFTSPRTERLRTYLRRFAYNEAVV